MAQPSAKGPVSSLLFGAMRKAHTIHRLLLSTAIISLLLGAVGATEDCREWAAGWPCDVPFCNCTLSETEPTCESAPDFWAYSGDDDSEMTCHVGGALVSVGGYQLANPDETGCGVKQVHGYVTCIWVVFQGSGGRCDCSGIQRGSPQVSG